MESYITKFNNLGGETIGEHKKNFHYFIKSLDDLNDNDRDGILGSLQTRNIQERLFLVQLLTRYKKFKEMMTILLSGNRILCKKVVSSAGFPSYLLENVTPVEFIEKICPEISFVTRMQLINYFSNLLNATLAEEYFKLVLDKYGLNHSVVLLYACNETFIMSYVAEYKLKIPEKTLIKLHTKYPGFLQFYFGIFKDFILMNFLCQYLALNDVDTLHDLWLKSEIEHKSPSIGKKGIMNYVKKYRSDVIDNGRFNVRHKLIRKLLSEDEFKIYFKNYLPETEDSFYLGYEIINIIKTLPVKKRGELLFSAYQEKYQIDFAKTHEYTNDLLEILSAEDRLKFDLKDADVVFQPVGISIPAIQEKINFTSDINSRSNLLNKLIYTSAINNDQDALLEILEYFLKRHKNEVESIRVNFMTELNYRFKTEKLSDQHWKCIDDLLLIFVINNENYYSRETYLENKILRAFLNKKDFTDLLYKYYQEYKVRSLDVLRNYPKYRKQCIYKFAEFIEKDAQIEDDTAVLFLQLLTYWNELHGKEFISYYDYIHLIDILFKNIEEFTRATLLATILNTFPKNKNDRKAYKDLLIRYLAAVPEKKSISLEIRFIMLKFYPHLCLHNIEDAYINSNFAYELSKVHYLSCSEEFRKMALEILENKSSSKTAAIMYLSFYEDFIEIASRFNPESIKIDIHENNIKDILQIRRSVLRGLKNYATPGKTIDFILLYCHWDYLQYALEPLYYVFYHSPNRYLESPLKILSKRAVSARKHAIYLSTMLLPIKVIIELLNEILNVEKNKSIQKFLIARVFRLLMQNPLDTIFDLFTLVVQNLDKNDFENLNLLMQLNKMPLKFMERYTKIIWNLFGTLNEKSKFIMLTKLTDDILNVLSDTFIECIIKESLFNSNNEYMHSCYTIVYKFLSKIEFFDERSTTIIQILMDYIEKPTDVFERSKTTSDIYNFFISISTDVINDKSELAEKLTTFKTISLINGKFKIDLLIDWTIFCSTVKEINIQKFAEFLVNYQKCMTKEHGKSVNQIYMNQIKCCMDMSTNTFAKRKPFIMLELAHEILNLNGDVETKLLAIDLLPGQISKNIIFKQSLKAIIDKLNTCEESVVKIYLSNYLSNLY